MCYFLRPIEDTFSLWSPEKWSGGFGGESGELLPSLSPSGLSGGWCRLSAEVNPLTWGVYGCSAAEPCTPQAATSDWQAPTPARGIRLPHGWPCLCFSYVAMSFLLSCSEHRTTQLGSLQIQVANRTAPRSAATAGPHVEALKSLDHTSNPDWCFSSFLFLKYKLLPIINIYLPFIQLHSWFSVSVRVQLYESIWKQANS